MKTIAFSLCLPLAVVGCGSADSARSGSSGATVRGALVTASFTATPTAVEAIDDTGATTRGTLAGDGSFVVVVAKGHTYRLSVFHGSSSEPIVFPRASGKLDTTFRASGGGAVVSLGAVKHFNSVPASGFLPVSASSHPLSTPPPSGTETTEAGECTDGVAADTGAVCVDDDAAATCEAGDGDGETQDDGQDGECKDGVDLKTGAACTDPVEGSDESENDEPAAAETEADGECENGVDAKTGASCVDEDADPQQPMAIPEHNAPDDIAGCDSEEDGEEKDG